jgi:tetratricopeptide (TPR) repeat protein
MAPFVKALILATLLLALVGCAPMRVTEIYPVVDDAVKMGNAEGLALENPYLIDDEIAATVDQEVGRWGTPYDRLHRVLRFMTDRGLLGFQYAQDVTVTAREAYHARRGNCMSYTNLFLGIARHLDVPVFLIHINEATSFYEKDGTFVVSTHMAVGYDAVVRITLVDLGGESDRLRVYERASDLAGFCLFYNNVAVEKMLSGDIPGAEKLLAFLVRIFPPLKETRNNLGALYLRQARYEEALALYTVLAAASPDYRPAFTNGLVAARGAGRQDLVERFAQGAATLAEKDPFYLFNQGVTAFQKGDYTTAESYFHRAASQQPHNPLVSAWLSRTYLQSGRTEEGIEEFRKAQELAPYHRILAEMRSLFPALEAVPPPSLSP